MRVVVVNGSPRNNGNTAGAMALIAEAAQSCGEVDVVTHHLNELELKGCQGCLKCKEPGAIICVLDDGGRQVLQDMFDADVWVLGTPVYMGHMTGQLKLLLDRTYGYLAPGFVQRLPQGKQGIAVLTQGRKEPDAYQGLIDMFLAMFSRRKFSLAESLVVSDCDGTASGNIRFSEEVKARAEELGKLLVTGI